MSKLETCIDHALQLINTGRPPGVPEVKRAPKRSTPPSAMPATGAWWVQDFPNHGSDERPRPATRDPFMPESRSIILVLEHYTKAGAGTTPDQELDPLLSWARESLCGGSWSGVAVGAEDVGVLNEHGEHEETKVAFVRSEQRIRISYTQTPADSTV